jgi:hypothetical protein
MRAGVGFEGRVVKIAVAVSAPLDDTENVRARPLTRHGWLTNIVS